MMKRSIFAAMLLCLTVVGAFAQGPNNSNTYYQSADGLKGEALKTAMFNIIKLTKAPITYDDLKDAYKKTDTRSDGYLRDWYSNITSYVPGGSMGGNSYEGAGWNREHLIPQSWFNSASPMYSDIMHVVPTDAKINNMRSNYPLAEVGTVEKSSANNYSLYGGCKTPGYSGTVFEPNDEVKGDIARIYFYMATCYQDKITSWSGGLFTENSYQPFAEWYFTMLMRWSKQDPVDAVEIARNNAVYNDTKQKNRNPFVDYPGLEDYIWGDKVNETFSYDRYNGVVTVYTPAFTLPSGTTFIENISVAISCGTPGASIYYTTDGTDPTDSSQPYTGVITLTETTTLKAVAYDAEGNSSSVATATYTQTSGETSDSDVYEKVTDSSQMVVGKKYILVYEGDPYASLGGISATSTKYGVATEITKNSDGTATINDDIKVLTLGSTANGWSLRLNDGSYLSWSSGNSLQTSASEFSWTISVSTQGATASVSTDASRKLQYNSNNPRFACYTSSQQPAYLYVQQMVVVKQDVSLSFSPAEAEATVGEPFSAPELTTDPAGLAVTFESSNTNVATVDAETGEVTPVSAGTAIITATFAGDDLYNGGSASYMLVVSDNGAPAGDRYELITDAGLLAAGDVIILANVDGSSVHAMSTEQKTNNRGATAKVTLNSDNTLTPGEDVQLITLEQSGENFLFNVGNAYLYAASSTSNQLKITTSANNANAKANITIGEGSASIVFQGTNTRNVLLYNPNNGAPLFSCYGSNSTGTTAPQIYRRVKNVITIPVSSVGYATTYYSDKNLVVPEGVEAYTYTVADGQLAVSTTYESGDVIPAGTGVVLKASEGSYDFEVSDEGGYEDVANLLRGSDESTVVSEPGYKYYMLSLNAQSDPASVGFYWGKNSESGTKLSCSAHKAYLAVPTGESTTGGNAGAKSFFLFNEAESTTGVQDVQSSMFNAQDDIFDLQGRKIGNGKLSDMRLPKGIYIVNGRKVVVR